LLRQVGFFAASVGANFLIQTYTPTSTAIEALRVGRYLWFYQQERQARQGRFPPSVELAVLFYHASNEQRGQEAGQRLLQYVQEACQELEDVELLGPAPAFPPRVRGEFRWWAQVRGHGIHRILTQVPAGWLIDVDPVTLG